MWKGTRCPSCFLTKEGSPIMGIPALEGSQLAGAKKVHSDLPPPSQAQTRRHAQQQSSGRPSPFFASTEHPSAKECVTCVWRKPSPWEVKDHPWGQSEGGGELPPGTSRGEACRSSSDHGVLAHQSASSLTQVGLPESSGAERNPHPQLPFPHGQSSFQKETQEALSL